MQSRKLPNLTEGKISEALIKLALPLAFTNVLQTMYNIIDMFWVGRLGKAAIAAVSASFPILFFFIALVSGLSVAAAILVSHAKGQRDEKRVSHVTTQALIIAFIVGTAISLFGYLLAGPALAFLKLDKTIYIAAKLYLQTVFLGGLFMLIFLTFQSVMRGIGEVKLPLYVVALSVILNFFLDPLFIFGGFGIKPMDVEGAAVATLITQTITGLVGLAILLKGWGGIRLERSWRLDKKLVASLIRLGFPASIEQSTRAFGMAVLIGIVAYFGTTALAAYGIATRLLSFVILPALALPVATSTIAGHNFGAKKRERIKEVLIIGAKMGFYILTATGILMFIFATPLVRIFAPNSVEVVELSADFIRIMALTFGFIGVQMAINGTIRGMGKTHVSMALSLTTFFLLRLPLAYFLSALYGIVGVWWAFPLSNILGATIAALTFWLVWRKLKIAQ